MIEQKLPFPNLNRMTEDGCEQVEPDGNFPIINKAHDHHKDSLFEKIKDENLQNVDGFPEGSPDNIIQMSILPYYTACPNPFLLEFIDSKKLQEDKSYVYSRKPFVADVQEGKEHPIYKAHPYHTKVPHRAIMRYILHYTKPGDVILDGFCGSGATGVAAVMCGNKEEVKALGFSVSSNGIITNNKSNDKYELGARKAILCDLAPSATFIAANNCISIDSIMLSDEMDRLLDVIDKECTWMYETKHPKTGEIGRINYTVWSEVFACSNCSSKIIFSESSDSDNKREITCKSCGAHSSKEKLELQYETVMDPLLGIPISRPKRVPTKINFSLNGVNIDKNPDNEDIEILKRIEASPLPQNIPLEKLPDIQMCKVGRMKPTRIEYVHQFMMPRALRSMGVAWSTAKNCSNTVIRNRLLYFIEQALWTGSVMNRYRPTGYSQNNQYLAGVFYVPSQHAECSPWYMLERKKKRLVKLFHDYKPSYGDVIITTQSSDDLRLPNDSVDYIFIDPPFGENIYYSDLNYIAESWHGVKTSPKNEAIIDKAKKKNVSSYQSIMLNCFKENYRLLKPGRWMTVEFSNTQAAIWNSIQSSLSDAGFIVANVSVLDKKQGTFQSVNTPTAVKQDLVISAYKPNGGFEARFKEEAFTEEGVWDFITTHMKYLPIIKVIDGIFLRIPERDPRILFDAMVAYFVRKGLTIPISSADFQNELVSRFAQRDGMFFLSDQVSEYDKNKILVGSSPQFSLLVSDEVSAIEWIRNRLIDKPQAYNDIQPDFMPLLSHLNQNERELISLNLLLEQNFLCYSGKTPVPEQIHAYLSSNWKEFRNLPKDNSDLINKACDRWYVPDPNKAGDLDKLREKALLKEFEEYKKAKKKLKVFRLEAVRTGFKKSWQDRDYAGIVEVADKIPNNILEEDPKLLMWYDQAVTRLGGE